LGQQRIVNWLKKDPLGFLVWQFKKARLLWSAPYYRAETLLPGYLLVYLYHWIVLGLGGLGIFIIILKKQRRLYWLVGLLGYISLLHAVFVGLDRYGMPFTYLWILAIGQLLESLKQKIKLYNT
jgi:hypothetical protein